MRTFLGLASLLALACAGTPAGPTRPPAISPGHPRVEGQSGGYYVWADADGWHLRTTATQAVNFTGTIAAVGGRIEDLRPMRADARYPDLRLTDRGIEFSLPTFAGVEGFDWKVTSGCNRFDLLVGGQTSPGLVRLGGAGDAPPSIPFELCE
jgi:hypothetical protein